MTAQRINSKPKAEALTPFINSRGKAYMFPLEKLKSTMLQEKLLDIMFTEEAIDVEERRLLATELGLGTEEVCESEF